MAQNLQKDREKKFLALGDSYTIGESVEESHKWPVQLVNKLRDQGYTISDPVIIATTGWRTDELRSAVTAVPFSEEFDMVSLLIGVNNYYQGKPEETYASDFEELLQIAIAHAGGKKENVFVLSIPDYGYTPFGKDQQAVISKGIDAFNTINRRITESYHVRYIDITPCSRKGLQDPELVASDGLHPSRKMYAQWVSLILDAQ